MGGKPEKKVRRIHGGTEGLRMNTVVPGQGYKWRQCRFSGYETWDKSKDRILSSERIPDCKAMELELSGDVSCLAQSKPFQRIGPPRDTELVSEYSSVYYFLIWESLVVLLPLKKKKKIKAEYSHVVDLHSGTSSVHRLAPFTDLKRYTDLSLVWSMDCGVGY